LIKEVLSQLEVKNNQNQSKLYNFQPINTLVKTSINGSLIGRCKKNPKKEKEKNKVNGKYPRRRPSPPNVDILNQYTGINQYRNISFP
jgi:hypothetical protein